MKATPGFLSTVLCGAVTTGLLRLCPPSEVMNRVIGEFISPHQSHVLALADTVFQVGDDAGGGGARGGRGLANSCWSLWGFQYVLETLLRHVLSPLRINS